MDQLTIFEAMMDIIRTQVQVQIEVGSVVSIAETIENIEPFTETLSTYAMQVEDHEEQMLLQQWSDEMEGMVDQLNQELAKHASEEEQ